MAHRIYRNGNGIVVFLILTAQMGLQRRTRGSAARRRPVILTVDDDPAVSAAIARLATI
jgi:hypothetical protein